MIDSERQGLKELFKIAAPCFAATFAYASLILFIEEWRGDHIYPVVGQIGSVFGIALAFFLGFRMNAAHDRWWEARKVLGEFVNNSKSFICKVQTYFGNQLHLKSEFREQTTSESMQQLTQNYILAFKSSLLDNSPISSRDCLLRLASKIDQAIASESQVEKFDLMQHINRFFEIQGRADRIRNTPFLMIYGAFTRVIVVAYVAMLPFFVGDIDFGGEASGLELLALPLLAFLGSIFLTINKLANLHAEPFSRNVTSLPVERLCSELTSYCATAKAD